MEIKKLAIRHCVLTRIAMCCFGIRKDVLNDSILATSLSKGKVCNKRCQVLQ